VEDVLDGLRPNAQEKAIELRLDRLDDCVLACSPGVLTSILSNLIENAIKYMGEQPIRVVTVNVRDLGARARIEVADSGPGVPPEIGDKLFSPFVRAAGVGVPGLGLGLASVRRLAEAHGGRVGHKPRIGGGTVFWAELRTATADAPRPVRAAAEREPTLHRG
jgi:signal transduction histidine kinase